jgi:hypothetical protein
MNQAFRQARDAYAMAQWSHIERLKTAIDESAQKGFLYAVFETTEAFREIISQTLSQNGYKYTVAEKAPRVVEYTIDFSFSEKE